MLELDTKIDERCRPGSLAGLATPGERYRVRRTSPLTIEMHLLVPAEMPKARIGKSHGRMVLVGGKITPDEVAKELEAFP